MSKEIPLQADLFTGELVDTRSRRQKKRDAEKKKPRQMTMFSQREIAQFGVRARPKIPISPLTGIALAMLDPRTAEERERDERLAAEKRTYPLPGIGPDHDPAAAVPEDGHEGQ